MKEIKLTREKVALVDDDDYEWLAQLKWCVRKNKNVWYAVRRGSLIEGGKIIRMHRAIIKTPKGMEVDHIDGNGLNNQKHNIRNCTHAQNAMNAPKRPNCSSKYIGVTWDKGRKKWQSRLVISQTSINIGRFGTEEEAARARDEVAKKYHGEFACLNFKE